MTVWTHTQGVFPDRNAIAEMMRMPKEKVRCIHSEGSGCYGHNGADDAAGDAALLARALPGRPVRVQWTREQEHAWEPYGPAMMVKVSAALDDSGKIADWDYTVWSNTHSMRPGPAGALIAARYLAEPFPEPPKPFPIPMPEGGGDRNSNPIYKFPSMKVICITFCPQCRSASRRCARSAPYMNIFSIESFMDELAAAAGTDPVEFRLKHLDDPRAREVVSTAAERFGWSVKPRAKLQQNSAPGHGYGFAFARYKNLAAYCAVACEVEINHETGRARMVRAVAAVDSGQVVNPDGIANQIEGAILQSMSWTLYENVTFDDRRITSVDWATYPILRFSAVPDSWKSTSSIGQAHRFSAAARPGRGQRRRSRRCRPPDHLADQPGVHQGPDRAGVADGGDAADDLAGPFSDRTGVGSSHLRNAGQPRYLDRIHAVSAAGHDEQRRPVSAEHQAVRDRAELAAELGGRGRGRRRALGQFPHLPGHAQVTKHGREPREVNWHASRLAGPRPPRRTVYDR